MVAENPRALAFVLSEANRTQSRDEIIIASGAGKLQAGTVLGKITASGKYVPSPNTGADGSQTAVAILAYPVDATSADMTTIGIVNNAEVKDPMLIFEATVNDSTKRATKLTQLRAVGIKSR